MARVKGCETISIVYLNNRKTLYKDNILIMQEKLFIPSKIKVGYQKRSDTYTKRLAFVIYYDDKGNLRKETSWQGWRDKKIPANDFDNNPHSGFIINKDVQRSSEWFGSGRNMIRIYDDRGIEFEITCDNLVFILMTTNCNKRELEGQFVYAWQGTELILLPTGCEEYKTSLKYSLLKSAKISKHDLVPGCSYKTKELKDLIYLGYFDYYECTELTKKNSKYVYDEHIGYKNISEKKHIFIDSKNVIVPIKGLTKIAQSNNDIPVTNYAELMSIFSQSKHGSSMTGLKGLKIDKINVESKQKYEYTWNEDAQIRKIIYLEESNGVYLRFSIIRRQKYNEKTNTCTILGFKIILTKKITFKKGNIIEENIEKEEGKNYTLKELEKKGFLNLFVVTQNGGEILYDKYVNDYFYSDEDEIDVDDDYNDEDEMDDDEIERQKRIQEVKVVF